MSIPCCYLIEKNSLELQKQLLEQNLKHKLCGIKVILKVLCPSFYCSGQGGKNKVFLFLVFRYKDGAFPLSICTPQRCKGWKMKDGSSSL